MPRYAYLPHHGLMSGGHRSGPMRLSFREMILSQTLLGQRWLSLLSRYLLSACVGMSTARGDRLGISTMVNLLLAEGCLRSSMLLLCARHMLAMVAVPGLLLTTIGMPRCSCSYVVSRLNGRQLPRLAMCIPSIGRRGGRLSTEVTTVCYMARCAYDTLMLPVEWPWCRLLTACCGPEERTVLATWSSVTELSRLPDRPVGVLPGYYVIMGVLGMSSGTIRALVRWIRLLCG